MHLNINSIKPSLNKSLNKSINQLSINHTKSCRYYDRVERNNNVNINIDTFNNFLIILPTN